MRTRTSLSLTRSCSVLLALALLAACDGSLHDPIDDEPPIERPPCEVPLGIGPAGATVGARGVLVLRGEGGTGAYRFTIEDDGGTGSRVGESTGVLVGGELPGEVVVRVEDRACVGDATATVTVSDRLVLEPASVEVIPGGEVRFAVRGGSGPFEHSLVRDDTGATMDATTGVYRAGASEGSSVVRVRDVTTGADARASVRVSADAGLRPLTPRVFVPVGSTHELAIAGGSGYLDAVASSGAIEVAGRAVRAVSRGSATLDLTDRYTGARATIAIDAVAPLDAPVVRVGDRLDTNTALTGDFDGDGDRDALLAMPGAGIGGHRAGAVYLWRNEGGALESAPARVLAGERRDDQLGSAVALGDLDGDGLADLVVGAWQADPSGANVGRVRAYRGVPASASGELFASAPMLSLAGVTGGDRFGVALAVCDFDGDGDQDLAVGAADAENRTVSPRNDQEGAVYVFPSYDGRFLTAPGQVIYGAIPDGAGGWTSHRDLRFGSALAAGDFDGDGRCDLAVHALRPDPAVGNDGAVLIFRGRAAATPGGQGGLEDRPALAIAAMESGDRGSRFGAFLAMGDLDGDGMADLAASQHLHDLAGGSANDAGAARVFRGRALSGAASAIAPASSADWTHEGGSGSRWYGHQVRIADANDDGRLDLLVCDSRAALEGSTLSRPGVLRVFHGRSGMLPASTPSAEHEGTSAEERFGQSVDALGGGALFVHAVYADGAGLDVGTPYVVRAGERRALELPGIATGRRFGQSLAIVGDVSGDGNDDLLVGAPRQSDMRTPDGTSRGMDHGAAYLYLGASDGSFPSAPSITFFDHPGHSESDWVGEDVGGAGDFDGDGMADLAIVARYEDRPGTFDTAIYAPDAACPSGSTSDTGAVLVYRGASGGPDPRAPAFAIFPPTASGRQTQFVAGGLDVDGDGLGDLVLGGPNWLDPGAADERRGGFAIVRGRAPDASGRIAVVCAADHVSYGDAANDELGSAIAPLGDLDGDGCDDFAVGAPLADRSGATDEGLVRLVFGFGGATCPATSPETITLRPMDRTSHAGRALASGVDLDGDGLAELVVGAPRYSTGAGEIGRVYVIAGAYLASLRGASGVQPLLGAGGASGWTIDGIGAGERAGSGVAIVPGIGAGGRGAIAIGGAFAAFSGAPDTGGVRFVSWTAGGPASDALAILSGETAHARSELGAPIAWGRAGARTVVAVGAGWGHAHSWDSGSAYALRF